MTVHDTGCPVCGGFSVAPATSGTITCENGHLISLNPDIPSSTSVKPAHFAEMMRRWKETA